MARTENEILRESERQRQISELKVISSNTGHYVGREKFDNRTDSMIPYSRLSDPFNTVKQAEVALKVAKTFKEQIEKHSNTELKYLYNNLSRTDAETRFKGNVIADTMKHDRQHEKDLEPKRIRPQELSR